MSGLETLDARDIMERFSEPLARAMAVFVKELMSADSRELVGPIDDAEIELSDEQLMQQLTQTIEEHERLAKTGELESIVVDDNAVSQAISSRIRWVMNEKGVSQAQVAERIGVSPGVVSRVLKNPGRSKVETIRKIAASLDIELRDIL